MKNIQNGVTMSYFGIAAAFIDKAMHWDDPNHNFPYGGPPDAKPTCANIKSQALELELEDPDNYWTVCKTINPYNEYSLYLFLPKSEVCYAFSKRLLEHGTDEQVRVHKIYPAPDMPVVNIINNLEMACKVLYPVAFNGYDIQRLFSDNPNPSNCSDQQREQIKALVTALVVNNDRTFNAGPFLKLRRGVRNLIYKQEP